MLNVNKRAANILACLLAGDLLSEKRWTVAGERTVTYWHSGNKRPVGREFSFEDGQALKALEKVGLVTATLAAGEAEKGAKTGPTYDWGLTDGGRYAARLLLVGVLGA